MRDAVADCDDGSSEDGMMLLSMPHDIPEVNFLQSLAAILRWRAGIWPS